MVLGERQEQRDLEVLGVPAADIHRVVQAGGPRRVRCGRGQGQTGVILRRESVFQPRRGLAAGRGAEALAGPLRPHARC